MTQRKPELFTKGDIASIYEETLSDGSHVYNVRVFDCHEEHEYVEVEAIDIKHATRILKALDNE